MIQKVLKLKGSSPPENWSSRSQEPLRLPERNPSWQRRGPVRDSSTSSSLESLTNMKMIILRSQKMKTNRLLPRKRGKCYTGASGFLRRTHKEKRLSWSRILDSWITKIFFKIWSKLLLCLPRRPSSAVSSPGTRAEPFSCSKIANMNTLLSCMSWKHRELLSRRNSAAGLNSTSNSTRLPRMKSGITSASATSMMESSEFVRLTARFRGRKKRLKKKNSM